MNQEEKYAHLLKAMKQLADKNNWLDVPGEGEHFVPCSDTEDVYRWCQKQLSLVEKPKLTLWNSHENGLFNPQSED